MKKKKYAQWNITIASTGGLAGVIIGTLIFSGVDWSAILGALSGFLLIFIGNLIYVKSKKDKTPEVDERTINNMRKYYAIIANVFLGVLFLALAAITYMGHDQVSISYLWIFVIAYMLISGVGALIVSRR
ncbi:hypothetical protein [Planococcus salinus]|uniref:DUF2178 domain-containing protein n=1 Tax=Planococcus salinus TaxID=1848460 RepID=A0A3M8P6S6_9BACL|nr:hypothetical protein [Planococcus salinus]RNF39377.1 hypothetical protein EEX84_09840 [Planococcus salinus]